MRSNSQIEPIADRIMYLTNPKADILNALTAALRQCMDARDSGWKLNDKTIADLDVAICKVAESIVNEEEEKLCKL